MRWTPDSLFTEDEPLQTSAGLLPRCRCMLCLVSFVDTRRARWLHLAFNCPYGADYVGNPAEVEGQDGPLEIRTVELPEHDVT